MLVPDFLLNSVDDQIIHPNGEIAHHLIEIASENPINISQYLINHAGTSSYFPITYLPYRSSSPGVELALVNGNHLDLIKSPQIDNLSNSNHISSQISQTNSMIFTDIKLFISTKFEEFLLLYIVH